MGKYLSIAETIHAEKHPAGKSARGNAEDTGAYDRNRGRGRDKSDISDRSSLRVDGGPVGGVTLTVGEMIGEIKSPNTGAAIQAACYRRGEITKENAIEWITKAILRRRARDTSDWQRYAPAVEAALTHPVDCGCDQCL